MSRLEGSDGGLETGDVLAKKYRITDFLGQGGMGLVYAALHLRLGKPVAIKLPRLEVRSRRKALARFEREARAALQLKSPHVVRVTDVDVTDDGTPFFVMELLVGKTLDTELRERGRLPVAEAVRLVLEAASGIAEAHARGIIHRDLKPHNLFVVEEAGKQRIKVLDFGISKLLGDQVAGVTTTNSRLGTPLYISPEQLLSAKHVDARSDIWSLGIILYELICGRTPFLGENAIAVAAAIRGEEPRRPSALVPEMSPELERAMLRALSKDPARRFQSIADFAAALAPFGPSGPEAARAAVPGAVAHPGTGEIARPSAGVTHVDSPREEPSGGDGTAGERSRRLYLALCAVLALCGLALLALALLAS